jgi:hypothetical protein
LSRSRNTTTFSDILIKCDRHGSGSTTTASMEVRLRNYILLHFAFRRRLIRSLVLCLFLASIGFVSVIGNDYASAIGGGNPALSGGRRVVGALNASRNPISACQVWFNLDDEDDLSRFDALRSCSIESALLRVNIDAAVCLLTDRIEQRKRRKNAKRIESTEWFKQLKVGSRNSRF